MTYADFSPYTNGIKISGSDGSICIYIYIYFEVLQWTAKVRSIMEWHVSFVCFWFCVLVLLFVSDFLFLFIVGLTCICVVRFECLRNF